MQTNNKLPTFITYITLRRGSLNIEDLLELLPGAEHTKERKKERKIY